MDLEPAVLAIGAPRGGGRMAGVDTGTVALAVHGILRVSVQQAMTRVHPCPAKQRVV